MYCFVVYLRELGFTKSKLESVYNRQQFLNAVILNLKAKYFENLDGLIECMLHFLKFCN